MGASFPRLRRALRRSKRAEPRASRPVPRHGPRPRRRTLWALQRRASSPGSVLHQRACIGWRRWLVHEVGVDLAPLRGPEPLGPLAELGIGIGLEAQPAVAPRSGLPERWRRVVLSLRKANGGAGRAQV